MAASERIDELRKRYDENQRRFFAPLANEYRKAGDLEQAIALCRLHLAESPANLSGQIVFGQALYDAGSFDEARATFETAISLDPENLIALRHLGDIARAQADIPKAKEWYRRVLDADRRNEDVIAIMAELDALEIAPGQSVAHEGELPASLLDVGEPSPPAEPEPAPRTPSAGSPFIASAPRSSTASLIGFDARPAEVPPGEVLPSDAPTLPMGILPPTPELPETVEIVAVKPPAAWKDQEIADEGAARPVEVPVVASAEPPAAAAPVDEPFEAVEFPVVDAGAVEPVAEVPAGQPATPPIEFVSADFPVVDVTPAHRDVADFGMVDTDAAQAEPPSRATPASSFGFDVDLEAAASIPVSSTGEVTPDFGVVELNEEPPFDQPDIPVTSAFSETIEIAEPGGEFFAVPEVDTTLPASTDFGVEPAPGVRTPAEPPPPRQPTPSDFALELPDIESAFEESPLPAADAPAEGGAEETPAPLEPLAPEPIEAASPVPELADEYIRHAYSPPLIDEPVGAVTPVSTFAPETPVVAATPVSTFAPETPVVAATPVASPGVPETPVAVTPAVAAVSETPLVSTPAVSALRETPLVATPVITAPDVAAAPVEAFATETMAELYVRQGLRHEAVAVYRRLIEARPGDESLRRRLAALEDDQSVVAGPTARSFFAQLAGRRKPRLTTPAAAPTPTFLLESVPPVEPEPVVPVDQLAPAPPQAGADLGALLGEQHVSPFDSNAAQALSTAFGDAPPPMPGKPARPASGEFSLDQLFGESRPDPTNRRLQSPAHQRTRATARHSCAHGSTR